MLFNHTASISDIRKNTLGLLEFVASEEQPVVITQHTKPVGILVSIAEYEQLYDAYLDSLDALEAKEYELEDKSSIVWLKEVEVFGHE